MRPAAVLSVLTAGWLLAASAAASEKQSPEQRILADSRWQLSQYLFHRHQYGAALHELRKAAPLLPRDARLLSMMGTLQILAGRFEDGEKTLLDAWKENTGDYGLSRLLGDYYVTARRDKRGLFFWEHALSRDADRDELRHLLIRAYVDFGQFDRAAPHIKLSLLRHKGRVASDLRFAYGVYLAHSGLWEESVEYLELAGETVGLTAEELFHLGVARMRVGRHKAAADAFERHVSLAGGGDEAYLAWGEALYHGRKWAAAEKAWTEGLRRYPRSFALLHRLMEHFIQTARPGMAEKVLGFAERKASGDPRLLLLRARYERKLDRLALAAGAIRHLKRQARGRLYREAQWESALIEFARGHLGQAGRTADKLIREGFRVPEAHLLKARIAAVRRDRESAADHIHQARRSSPSDPRITRLTTEAASVRDDRSLSALLQVALSGLTSPSAIAQAVSY